MFHNFVSPIPVMAAFPLASLPISPSPFHFKNTLSKHPLTQLP